MLARHVQAIHSAEIGNQPQNAAAMALPAHSDPVIRACDEPHGANECISSRPAVSIEDELAQRSSQGLVTGMEAETARSSNFPEEESSQDHSADQFSNDFSLGLPSVLSTRSDQTSTFALQNGPGMPDPDDLSIDMFNELQSLCNTVRHLEFYP